MICNAGKILQGLIDVVFPPRCGTCGKVLAEGSGPYFCEACRSDFDLCMSPLCPSCGIPYADRSGTDHLCERCLTSPPPYSACRSVATYRGVLQEAIHRVKYGRDVTVGEMLGELMAECSDSLLNTDGYSMVLPVPLHTRKLRERGFNQSLLLSRPVARRRGLKLDYTVLKKKFHTEPQISFGRTERTENLKGAFEVTDPLRIKGEKIVLIDDVFTTGSTVRECARALKKSGAEAVSVFTLCRTLN